jgi:two-component system NtrC family sensor kinase
MQTPSQTRFVALVLALATLAACVFAGLNLSSELHFDVPTDGVWWVEAPGGLRAEQVPPSSPGERAGIRKGDLLIAVDDRPTPTIAPLTHEQYRSGVWGHATYSLLRPMAGTAHTASAATQTEPQGAGAAARPRAAPLDIQIILEPTDRSLNEGYRIIALVYLGIGLYVLFRRWTAPKSLHFYVFCLVSFVLYSFKYTGEFDGLDWTIYWSNVVATALQPALFLHFAISFTGFSKRTPRQRLGRILMALLYVPGLCIAGLQLTAIRSERATELLHHRLDQISVGYLALFYVIATLVFQVRYRRATNPLERQQLKWLSRGAFIAVTPFTLLYVIPYLSDWQVSPSITRVAGLSLVFVPLTFSWAIVRYRLMDTDLIFKRGVTYTLVTAALASVYFAVVAATAELVHTRYPSLRVWGPLAGMVVFGLIFDPLKRMIQGRVDRVFDRKRYDYRETLVEFGRRLNGLTELPLLLDSIVERLPQTLLVTRLAVFLPEDLEPSTSVQTYNKRAEPRFYLAASHGLTNLAPTDTTRLDLGFLQFDEYEEHAHLFLENPEQALRLPEPQRHTAQELDLSYYLPCRVANRQGSGSRTVAVIGLGRTHDGDFLSSEDMELLESLAGYIGIAIQNAQLYRRLEAKIGEFERLKDFNENIVESINIGIFAVDLDDRIDSWNAQMETMLALPREQALRQPLDAIFPQDFVQTFHDVRREIGSHTLYKFRLELPNGEARTANIAIAPLLTRDLETVGRIILVDDITDRLHLEDQLTQAEKLSSIGLLAAGVAHEVNTPLAVISSYTQMLTKQTRDDERLGKVLEKITQQTFRASEIVNGLLNFSRTSGAAFTSLDLNAIVHDTVLLLEHQMRTAGVVVEQQLDSSLPAIHGNQGKLQQVMLNLLLNAKDAMHGIPQARLHIQSLREHGRVVLRISDNGSGIEGADLHRIFDPFFTTKGTPAEGQRKGTGLGLAVTYGIMQEHKGKIGVESTPGVGTTFRLEFPTAARPLLPVRPSPVLADGIELDQESFEPTTKETHV